MDMKKILTVAAVSAMISGLNAAEVKVSMETGVRGNALKFAGEKYGIYNSRTVFDLTKGFTVSMWLKPEQWPHLTGLLNNMGSMQVLTRSGGSVYFWGQPDRKTRQGLIYDPENITIPLKQWSHLAFSYDQQGNTKVYINGKMVSAFKNKENFRILNHPGRNTIFMLGDKYVGLMDEVYIYERVLDDSEVAGLQRGKAPAGAAAAYLMDDPASPGKDSSGSKRDLTVQNLKAGESLKVVKTLTAKDITAAKVAEAAKTLDPVEFVDGVRGKAVRLNGFNTYLQEVNRKEFNLRAGATVSFWLRPQNWTHLATLVCNVGDMQIMARGHVGGGIYFWANNTHPNYSRAKQLLWCDRFFPTPLNQWSHIAITYDQKGHAIGYYNGKKVTEQRPGEQPKGQEIITLRNIVSYPNARMTLGKDYCGDMDEVYVYGRVLSEKEIASLYDGKAPAGAQAAFLMDDVTNPGKDSSDDNRQMMYARGIFGGKTPELGGAVNVPALAYNDVLTAWPRGSMDRVFRNDYLKTVKIGNQPLADMAGNEYEAFQVALTSKKDFKNVKVSVGDFKLGNTVCESEARLVDYVKLSSASNIKVPKRGANVFGESVSVFPGKDTVPGWYPDRLRKMPESFAIKANETRAIWITVKTPANAPAGIYKAVARVQADNTTLEIPLSIRVRGFSLPEPRERVSRHTAACNPVVRSGNYEPFYRMLSRYYISADSTKNPVKVKFSADHNSVELDTAAWDKEMDMAINKYGQKVIFMPLFGIYGMPKGNKVSGERLGVQVMTSPGVVNPVFEKRLTAYLKAMCAHLKSKGWLKNTFFSLVDEPHSQADFALSHSISRIARKAVPELKIFITKWPTRESIGVADVWCIGALQPGQIKAALARGEIVEQYPNWHMLIDRPAMDRRMLGFQMYKYGLTGILHYSIGDWRAPERLLSPQYTYPDGRILYGSGLVMYPGKDGEPEPSVRADTVRDALDDFEYLMILKKLAAKRPGDPAAKEALEYAKNAADKLVPCYEAEGDGLNSPWKELKWELDHNVLLEYRKGIMDRIEKLMK